jgi:hypothetical protein
MLMAVRIYGSEANAREAARKLVEAGFRKDLVHVLTPDSGGEQAVRAAVSAKKLPASHLKSALAALGNGRSIVSVPLPYYGQETLEILDSCDPVEMDSLPASQLPNDPAPFSEMLGIPVLTKNRGASTQLLNSGPSFKSFLGLPLLSKPKSKTTSFGLPLLTKPKSKTTSFGLPLLSKPKSKTTSFGLPLLTKSKK